MDNDLWTYPETMGRLDVTGFKVEAADGSIDTGVWIFGKKVILPAGLIERVDRDQETLYIAPTKDEIKDAPEFDDDASEDYRSAVNDYYLGRRNAVRNAETTSHSLEHG
jgi:hypothetical protein